MTSSFRSARARDQDGGIGRPDFGDEPVNGLHAIARADERLIGGERGQQPLVLAFELSAFTARPSGAAAASAIAVSNSRSSAESDQRIARVDRPPTVLSTATIGAADRCDGRLVDRFRVHRGAVSHPSFAYTAAWSRNTC